MDNLKGQDLEVSSFTRLIKSCSRLSWIIEMEPICKKYKKKRIYAFLRISLYVYRSVCYWSRASEIYNIVTTELAYKYQS